MLLQTPPPSSEKNNARVPHPAVVVEGPDADKKYNVALVSGNLPARYIYQADVRTYHTGFREGDKINVGTPDIAAEGVLVLSNKPELKPPVAEDKLKSLIELISENPLEATVYL
jgi:hypothetical protein